MALRILLLLLIGLGSTSAQLPHYVPLPLSNPLPHYAPLPHCVPCTKPFNDFDYHNACDEILNSTDYFDENQQPILVPVIDITENHEWDLPDEKLGRKSSWCLPCNGSFVDFDAKCDDFRFLESEKIENINKCNEENHEVFFEGRCQTLLKQGTCPEKHWLVINNKTTGPICEYNKCFFLPFFSVIYEGSCLNLNTGDGYKCRRDKVLVVSPDGTAHCDCSDERVKLPYWEECTATRLITSGCAPNWVLEKSFDGNPVCVRNFCSDDEIYLDGRCWTLSPHCKVGSEILNTHGNIIRCVVRAQYSKPTGRCLRNAARIDGKCPSFSNLKAKSLPFV